MAGAAADLKSSYEIGVGSCKIVDSSHHPSLRQARGLFFDDPENHLLFLCSVNVLRL
ncbi:hypothetical protein SynA1544_01136 [Synechococcus sp. A15-44]|nr:hypothetical protein SynA1544_01136 [Synechococcus sp. A15-44]